MISQTRVQHREFATFHEVKWDKVFGDYNTGMFIKYNDNNDIYHEALSNPEVLPEGLRQGSCPSESKFNLQRYIATEIVKLCSATIRANRCPAVALPTGRMSIAAFQPISFFTWHKLDDIAKTKLLNFIRWCYSHKLELGECYLIYYCKKQNNLQCIRRNWGIFYHDEGY